MLFTRGLDMLITAVSGSPSILDILYGFSQSYFDIPLRSQTSANSVMARRTKRTTMGERAAVSPNGKLLQESQFRYQAFE